MAAPLQGITVLDMSRVLAGPYATMLLADLGATVIKVERPIHGDDTRSWGPPFDANGTSTYFQSVNRNKSSITIDLKNSADQAALRKLAADADILIENFRPGQLSAYGFGYEELSAQHPALIYCSISGFGSGAGADLAGYDLLVQAASGLMSVTGTEEPTKVGVALVDVITGLHAAVGILAALHEREKSGLGQRVEVNLLSSALSALVNQASAYLGTGTSPTFLGNAHPSITPYETYLAADMPMVIALGNDAQFTTFARVLNQPQWATDPRFATNADRVAHRAELAESINDVLAGNTAEHWFSLLTAAGLPAGPINTIPQAFAFAETLGLNPRVSINGETDHGTPDQVANPIQLSRTPVIYWRNPPHLGADDARLRNPSTDGG